MIDTTAVIRALLVVVLFRRCSCVIVVTLLTGRMLFGKRDFFPGYTARYVRASAKNLDI